MPHLDDQEIAGIWCSLHSHDARRQCIYPLCTWRLLFTHSCSSMKKKKKDWIQFTGACLLFICIGDQLTIYSVLMQTKQQKVDHSWSKVQGYQVRLTTNTIVYSCKRIQMLVIKMQYFSNTSFLFLMPLLCLFINLYFHLCINFLAIL